MLMNEVGNLLLSNRNFAGLSAPFCDFDTSRVVILPVPYDSTTEWHSGSRDGPKAIIDASYYLEWYDIELEREIYEVGIHTLPEFQPSMKGPEETIGRIYRVSKDLLEKSKYIVTLGGEHSISSGIIRAYKEKYSNLSVLQLDAHADLRDEYLGTRFSHACVMRRVYDVCPIVQAGIRSLSLSEKEFISSNNLESFLLLDSNPLPLNVERVIRSLTQQVYITIDLDVFDPSIMEAVATPEPGGLKWHEVISLLRAVSREKRIVGFDVVELCPGQGPAACSFLAAKLAYKLIGYSFV